MDLLYNTVLFTKPNNIFQNGDLHTCKTIAKNLPRGSGARCVGGRREEEVSCCVCGTGGANMPVGGSGAETGG